MLSNKDQARIVLRDISRIEEAERSLAEISAMVGQWSQERRIGVRKGIGLGPLVDQKLRDLAKTLVDGIQRSSFLLAQLGSIGEVVKLSGALAAPSDELVQTPKDPTPLEKVTLNAQRESARVDRICRHILVIEGRPHKRRTRNSRPPIDAPAREDTSKAKAEIDDRRRRVVASERRAALANSVGMVL